MIRHKHPLGDYPSEWDDEEEAIAITEAEDHYE